MNKILSHRGRFVTALMLLPLTAVAADVPNLFKPGDVILSAKVNENFKALADRLTMLEDNTARPNPWVKLEANTTKAAFDKLMVQYPLTKYQWGIQYNDPGMGAVHHVTFSAWNSGIRVMTEEYIVGDGDTADPPGGFSAGGAAWFYDTKGSFDDACTNAGTFKHYYWVRSGSGISFTGSNGCGTGTWYVRQL